MYRFSPGRRFRWRGVEYEVRQRRLGGVVHLIELATGAPSTVSEEELVTAFFAGQLSFAGDRAPEEESGIPTAGAFQTLEDCTLGQQLVARYRHWVILPLAALPDKARTRQAIKERIEQVALCLAEGNVPEFLKGRQDGKPSLRTRLSVTVVYSWLHAYEQSGGDIRSLIPRWHRRGRRQYLDPAVEQIVADVIDQHYLRRESHSLDDIFREVRLRVEETNTHTPEKRLEAPSRSTIHNRIHQMDARQRIEACQGKRAARRAFSQYGEMAALERPLGRVEIDHTPVDIILVDSEDGLPLGRPTLTSVLDIATRYPLGYYLGFEPPSYLAVCQALAHAFKPKADARTKYDTTHQWIAYGLPNLLVVDNGREFRGRSLEDACLSLGITLQFTPKRTPHFKGSVERLFQTQNTGLFHTLEGTTFASIFSRGDYRSLEMAKLTLGDIDNALHIFLLDYYAERFHEGLQGIPARRWEHYLADGFQPRLPANVADIDILLGRVLSRTLFHYGVEIDGLRYNHSDLAALRDQLKRGDKVKVKYHPGDISTVYIHNPFDQSYIRAPAVSQRYAEGLSLWKHRLIRAYLQAERGRVDQEGLAWAKRKMSEIVSQAKERRRQSRSRKRLARWQTNGLSAQNVSRESSPAEGETAAAERPAPAIAGETPAVAGLEQPLSELVSLKLHFTLEELEADGWRTSRQ